MKRRTTNFLEVVCGTSAIFTIRIKLTKSEIESFKANPENARIPAYQILDTPSKFLHRRA
jgi:hypothetical protein